MQDSTILKNELIFQYAAGTASMAKSLMASTYLFLNSREIPLYSQYENYCGEELNKTEQVQPENLNFEQCIVDKEKNPDSKNKIFSNPINKFIESYRDIKWKKVFNGFYEHSFKLSKNESGKLIKMDPGKSAPLHSHSGREYILVLEGSFKDQYGSYAKGSLQINDSKIKHTPIACDKEGCICLSITEQELVFYGPFAPILNLITFIKSIFSPHK